MSIEIVLIPLAIAVTKEIAEGISKNTENKKDNFTILDTRMKDESLLKLALEEWSCSFREVVETHSLRLNNENEMTFLMNKDGCYSLIIPKKADKNGYLEWLDKVEISYTHYLQQRVYQNLIEQAKSQGMVLESEKLLEDNSIQVTYIIN